jgi:hypothetical protein
MNNIPGIIIVTDVKTNAIVYSNLATERFLHMNQSEVRSISTSNLLTDLGSTHLINAHDQVKAFCRPVNVHEDCVEVGGTIHYISARVLPMVLSADREYLLTIITDISDDVANRNRQLLMQEFAFALENVSSTQDVWSLVMEMLPKISGFEAIAVYQLGISDDYVLFMSNGGRFDPVIPLDSIVDRIIRKREPTIFDKYRMDLFPEGIFSTTDDFTSFVFMPIVHENRTIACIVLGSTKQRSPDTMFRGVVVSTSFQISSVASRCFLQERL